VVATGEKRGLVLVNTGPGKGKTTAALGQVTRALGQGMRVCVIQFIKGKWPTGEAAFFAGQPGVDFLTLGSGFTWEAEKRQEVVATALKAWEVAKEKVQSASYDLVVLDELTYLLTYEIISDQELLELIDSRPQGQHLVITGRDASEALVARADLVTEMRLVKHPFSVGIKAQKGVEF